MAKRKSSTRARAKKPAAETTTQDSKPDSAPSTVPATPSPDTPPPANPSTAPAPPSNPPPADPLPVAASAKTDGKADPLEVPATADDRPAITRQMAVELALGTASMVFDCLLHHDASHEGSGAGVDPSWIVDTHADDVNAIMAFAALELAPFLDRYPEAPAEAAHNHARKVAILPPEAPAWADAPAAVRIAFEAFTVHYRHLAKIADDEADRIARLALEDEPPGELPERLKRQKIGFKKNRRFRQSPTIHDKGEVKKRQAAAKRRQRRLEKAQA